MATHSAWKFNPLRGADEALAKLEKLSRHFAINLRNAAVVSGEVGRKKPKTVIPPPGGSAKAPASMNSVRLLSVSPAWAVAIAAILGGSYHLHQGIGPFIGNVILGVIFGVLFLRWGRGEPDDHRARTGQLGGVHRLHAARGTRLVATVTGPGGWRDYPW